MANRIIKFRAWDLNNGKMYPTSYIVDDNGNFCCNGDFTNNCEVSEEDKVIQMQFTGLKDKNKKEIYEGDIVNFFFNGSIIKREFICEVKYEGSSFLLLRVDKKKREDKLVGALDEFPKNCEVIGNIYEDKKLLGDKNE